MYMFESSVNSEYSKTLSLILLAFLKFESSVNSEYSKTDGHYKYLGYFV